MTSQTLKTTAELALCRALPDMCRAKQGRVSGQLDKLKKETDRLLVKMPQLKDSDKQQIAAVIDRFRLSTGWDGRGRHVMTYVSFLLAVLDGDEKYSRIIHVLNSIADYFDRANKAPAPCFWAGALACKKWESCMSSVFRGAA